VAEGKRFRDDEATDASSEKSQITILMSECNHSHQSSKMNASALSPKEGGGSNGEFIVHMKHTCDMCFQRPIIGQRFKSDVNPNFDLCARCFQAYSGPDIGLTEEVLSKSGL
jgi:hypothetical protein